MTWLSTVRRFVLPVLQATAWAVAPAAAWSGPPATPGPVVAIGGALRDDNDAVWSRLVALAGGAGARFAVLATASGQPDASAAAICAQLARHGAVGVPVRISPLLADVDVAVAVADPRWVDVVRRADAVFFSGGAQARLVDTLRPGGIDSPVLAAVRALHQRGGVVAGTSSGAAVMSATMFRDAPDVLAVLKGRLREGDEIDAGFGLLPTQVMVDQHFVERGRIGRLLPAMAARGLPLGLGVGEDTAAVVRGDEVEVVGRGGVVVADMTDATVRAGGPFGIAGVRLSYLAAGDRFDLASRRLAPAAARAGRPLAAGGSGQGGYFGPRAFYPDLLADGMLVHAMTRLLDSAATETRGLSFDATPAADDPDADLGFEWRLYEAADTAGWTGEPGDGATAFAVRLDVTPVRMARPLYRPLDVTAPPAGR